ncbi:hypothetical protein CROQUDRAFT_30442, partial [Cronartium quercuum f. sp. fusiforme G11]
ICAQLFIDPSLEAFASLLVCQLRMSGCFGTLVNRMLANFITSEADEIHNTLPKDYSGEDGSKATVEVSTALREIENKVRSTFCKHLLYQVLPTKTLVPSAAVPNLIDFCGY